MLAAFYLYVFACAAPGPCEPHRDPAPFYLAAQCEEAARGVALDAAAHGTSAHGECRKDGEPLAKMEYFPLDRDLDAARKVDSALARRAVGR